MRARTKWLATDTEIAEALGQWLDEHEQAWPKVPAVIARFDYRDGFYGLVVAGLTRGMLIYHLERESDGQRHAIGQRIAFSVVEFRQARFPLLEQLHHDAKCDLTGRLRSVFHATS